MATTTRFVTDEELLQAPSDGQKYERVDGEMRVSPAGGRHGDVIVALTIRLGAFVTWSAGSATSWNPAPVSAGLVARRTDPTTSARPTSASSPQAAFLTGVRPVGFIPFAPDLAVEVLSPVTGAATCSRRSVSTSTPDPGGLGDRPRGAHRCRLSKPHGRAHARRDGYARRRGRRPRLRVIDPQARNAAVYRSMTNVRTLGERTRSTARTSYPASPAR